MQAGTSFMLMGAIAMLVGSAGVWVGPAPAWVKFGLLFVWGLGLVRAGRADVHEQQHNELIQVLVGLGVSLKRTD